MPAGRPTTYKKEYCDALIEHMRDGFSFETFAAKIGRGWHTLYDWLDKHPEFLEAKKKADALCLYWWEQEGKRGMWVGDDGPKFNSAMWIFNMKARFGWRDVEKQPNVTIQSISSSQQEVSVGKTVIPIDKLLQYLSADTVEKIMLQLKNQCQKDQKSSEQSQAQSLQSSPVE